MPGTAWLQYTPEQGDNPRTDQESHCAAASSGLLASLYQRKHYINFTSVNILTLILQLP